jgi:hypothetical protein
MRRMRRSIKACRFKATTMESPDPTHKSSKFGAFLLKGEASATNHLFRIGTKTPTDPVLRAYSSVGRARPLQGCGRGFKSLCAHPNANSFGGWRFAICIAFALLPRAAILRRGFAVACYPRSPTPSASRWPFAVTARRGLQVSWAAGCVCS